MYVKIIEIQFKIIHRILACNEYLFETKIRPNPDCNSCPAKDSLDHFLFFCPQTLAFWTKVNNLYNQIQNENNKLEFRTVLLGPETSNALLEGLVVHGKWFVYKRKMASAPLNFDCFLKNLQHDLNVEKMGIVINPRNNRLNKFNNTWSNILDVSQ